MDKFTSLTSVAAPLPLVNIDTDMIIPKQFLKTVKRTGLKAGLFYELRTDEDGNPVDFVLDEPAYKNAQILVTGDNFGCGSSRNMRLGHCWIKVFAALSRQALRIFSIITVSRTVSCQLPCHRKTWTS